MVFHPKFPKDKGFFLYHTLQNPKRSVLVERRIDDLGKLSVDPSRARVLLEISQPYWNHNSGIPVFGPDGFLYLSTGDGAMPTIRTILAKHLFFAWEGPEN